MAKYENISDELRQFLSEKCKIEENENFFVAYNGQRITLAEGNLKKIAQFFLDELDSEKIIYWKNGKRKVAHRINLINKIINNGD